MTNEMYRLVWDAPTRMYGYGFVCDGRDIVLGLLWDKKYFVLYTCTHTYIIHLYTCMHVLGELPSLGAWKRGRHRHCPLPLHFLLIRFNLIRYCKLGTAHSCV